VVAPDRLSRLRVVP
jgi:tetratricopeptide (TPR) repeat protein